MKQNERALWRQRLREPLLSISCRSMEDMRGAAMAPPEPQREATAVRARCHTFLAKRTTSSAQVHSTYTNVPVSTPKRGTALEQAGCT